MPCLFCMVQNAPIVEFVIGNDVTFRVIVENFGNNKTPTHPAVLQRYDGDSWREVDRWDIESKEESDLNDAYVHTKDNDTIVNEARTKIDHKPMFKKDGSVEQTNKRYGKHKLD